VEAIHFSSSFAAIFWMKKRGFLPAFSFANQFISADEALHVEFAVLLYNTMLKRKLDQQTIHKIVQEAVECEIEFVCEAIHVAVIGMNQDLMAQYVRFVADRLLTSLKVEKIYQGFLPSYHR
jgi:ribonucleoside-diphosphate reductase subunit M2